MNDDKIFKAMVVEGILASPAVNEREEALYKLSDRFLQMLRELSFDIVMDYLNQSGEKILAGIIVLAVTKFGGPSGTTKEGIVARAAIVRQLLRLQQKKKEST